ncbi:GNAT family N-acetyltransferase [Clostridium sp. C105KSO13]|uniref:GNAT family N-acetyltransferase n=1 Tax=Clostridium sp. C105KSO13 TaxID=1776045 RepID=UPI00074084FF|nr:N-acetyltransferase [Clostridium sp. C105KSO13]CUX17794.1 Acetyltransferase (GNAT) family protein [Clostridium sp. C105KSO13]
MNIIIRQETKDDYKITETVVEKAFGNEKHSNHSEQFLVAELRKGNVFIPELSIVAEVDRKIVGHAMFTKLLIKNGDKNYASLALAPVSVLPGFQNQGIGSKMILYGLNLSKELGFKSVIVLGHEKYYPRFGFKPASKWGIKAPYDVPNEAFMAVELEKDALDNVAGTVVYGKEFSE